MEVSAQTPNPGPGRAIDPRQRRPHVRRGARTRPAEGDLPARPCVPKARSTIRLKGRGVHEYVVYQTREIALVRAIMGTGTILGA